MSVGQLHKYVFTQATSIFAYLKVYFGNYSTVYRNHILFHTNVSFASIGVNLVFIFTYYGLNILQSTFSCC